MQVCRGSRPAQGTSRVLVEAEFEPFPRETAGKVRRLIHLVIS